MCVLADLRACLRVLVAPIALIVALVPAALAQSAAGGASSSVVLKSDGTVWTFGQNNHGQIGDGLTASPRKTPYQVV